MPPATLLLYCLTHLEYLSHIRKLNERKKWGIRFDGINTNKLYNKNIDTMNQNIVIAINSQNPSNQLDDVRLSMINNEVPCSNLVDFFEITNGHDFVHIFSKLSNNSGVKLIESSLRCAFSLEAFSNSQLYQNLQQYENKHSLSILTA